MPIDVDQPPPTLDFKKESQALLDLVSSWSEEENKCSKRRELRKNQRSVQEERQKKTILEDETIIPDRTINSNIRRSKVAFQNYITQSKRALIITDVEKPIISIDPLELWFTRGMRYPGWKSSWFRMIDSMHVHGGCALEVIYDDSKPLNFAIEYVPREFLIFPLKAKNLQACPRIMRIYEVSSIQLEQYAAEYGFDQSVVDNLKERFHKNDVFIKIYRVLMKVQGIVYNAWWAGKEGMDRWLREPKVHDIGLFDFDPAQLLAPVPVQNIMPMQMSMMGQPPMMEPMFLSPVWETARGEFAKPMPLKSYPLFWFPFQETEDEILLNEQGRVSLDLHVQEAMTHLLSNTVNASTRASNFYPCAETLPGDDAQLAELGPLKPGVVMSRKLVFNQPPWPNNIILSVMQALRVGKADESGQTDFAATARKDANKTAKEMELATQQADLVTTADMDVFSTPVLQTLALAFNIACHQAIFLLCKRPPNPELLIGDYNLQPAGDIEVVKRQEDKANAKEFFNIVQGTPTAEKILQFLIQRFFPDQADEWLAALNSPDKTAIIAQLVAVLQTVPTDDLTPEQKISLGNLIAAAQSVVGNGPDQTVPGQSGPSQTNAPQPSNAMQQAR